MIGGVDVEITPKAEDLAVFEAQGYTTPEAINAALATTIPNSDGIPAWQALFLGLEPSVAGLDGFKIKSIALENGVVKVAIADGVSLKTDRGLNILLKVYGSDNLAAWSEQPIVTATNTTAIPDITPALGEVKKFYKVVVEFAAAE